MKDIILDKSRNRTAVISGIFFLVFNCLYRWTNLMYNHDSLLIMRTDTSWQISLGRYLVPVYFEIRGKAISPMVVALFGGTFIILSIIMCIHILYIRKKSSVIICAGLLATFETIAYLNASFVMSFEVDMLALLCVCIAAWLMTRSEYRFRYPAAWICKLI